MTISDKGKERTMSTKYEQLIRLYADDIAEIKRLQKFADDVLADAKKSSEGIEDEYEIFVAENQAYRAWDAAMYNVNVAKEKLHADIEAEYANVPYSAPAQRGIEKFYELAGI
jgi:hypothetical protein